MWISRLERYHMTRFSDPSNQLSQLIEVFKLLLLSLASPFIPSRIFSHFYYGVYQVTLTHHRARFPSSSSNHCHGQHSCGALQIRHPHRHRSLLCPSFHLWCQRWYSCCHLRSSEWSQGDGREWGHPFPHSLAAKVHHLWCPHQAQEYLHHDRQQGFANG